VDDPTSLIYDPIPKVSIMEKKVKLQKQKAYEYEGHPIFKYRLNLPSELIKELDWDKDSMLLLVKIKDKKLEIAKAG
jgi:hypothetical protein